MADRKQGAGLSSGSSAAVHKAKCEVILFKNSMVANAPQIYCNK